MCQMEPFRLPTTIPFDTSIFYQYRLEEGMVNSLYCIEGRTRSGTYSERGARTPCMKGRCSGDTTQKELALWLICGIMHCHHGTPNMKTNKTKAKAPSKAAPKQEAAELELVNPSQGPQTQDDKGFKLDLDKVGVVFSDRLTASQWQAAGVEIATLGKVSAFALGDWLKHGKEHFPEGFKSAAKITGLSEQYLRSCSSVASRFPHGERFPALSLEHHRLLGAIPNEAARKELAERATKEKLSTAALKEVADQWKTPPPELTAEQKAAKVAIDETKHLKAVDDAMQFFKGHQFKETRELWQKAASDLMACVFEGFKQ